MKKIIFVIPITILFVLLSSTISAHAATYRGIFVKYTPDPSDDLFDFYFTTEDDPIFYYSEVVNDQYGRFRITCNKALSVGYFSGSAHHTLNDWMIKIGTGSGIASNGGPYLEKCLTPIIGNNATIFPAAGQDTADDDIFDDLQDYEDYINPPPPEPTWFEIWGNALDQFLQDWLPWAVDLDHYFDDLTMWMFGMELDGDDVKYGNDIEYYDFPTPTPFPTQIPYQEQIVPDGNGGFTVQYVYLNPSGTPITATAPPPEPTYSIQITDSPQYDISGVPVPPADGLQDAIDAIDDNIDDYQEGFEAIHGSFSTIPIKWFFFFGIPAAILLIAGIIRSLLGG